ncbi:MAG: hypothetical protein H0W97_09245 [Actinobacteria bacterium]|nr:hypothetical protein [Actinomycetota bacterium]
MMRARALLVFMVALGACGGGGQALTGSVEAPECGGGYDLEFADVELRNASGEIIGSATTSEDKATDLPGNVSDDDPTCRVEFAIDDVPDSTFYELKIGSHDGPTYSADELEQQDWHVELSLS